MNKFRLLNWVLVALTAFYFTSCSNEALEGEFLQPNNPAVIEIGQFKAEIDDVEFLATVVNATLTPENLLTISGIIDLTGETITLTVADAGIGSFDLITGISNVNGAQYYAPVSFTNPYTSASQLGGSGRLFLTEFDTTDLIITGSFNFVGKRIQLDLNGDPVLDPNGNPNVQEVEVSSGGFNKISYVLDDTGGGGGGGGGTDPVDEFTALIEGVEFFEDSIATTLTTIGGVEMLKIVAQTSTNSRIRIDLPLFTGVGTFPMEPISDGTRITALYNSNTGGENLTSNPGAITIIELDTEEGILIAAFEFAATDPLGFDPTVVAITSGAMIIYFEGIPGSGPKPFTAEVDSVLYEPDPTDIDITIGLQAGVERVTLATTIGEQSMSLTFPKDIIEGSYDMSNSLVNPENVVAIYKPMTGSTPNFASSPGVLTIESYDTITGKIEGTFSYTALDRTGIDPTEYDVANGSFRVTIE
ncbi:MAG: hypothetical protein ACJAUR_002250 [Ulvibacter sp.]|jgi:hypothetical protein